MWYSLLFSFSGGEEEGWHATILSIRNAATMPTYITGTWIWLHIYTTHCRDWQYLEDESQKVLGDQCNLHSLSMTTGTSTRSRIFRLSHSYHPWEGRCHHSPTTVQLVLEAEGLVRSKDLQPPHLSWVPLFKPPNQLSYQYCGRLFPLFTFPLENTSMATKK